MVRVGRRPSRTRRLACVAAAWLVFGLLTAPSADAKTCDGTTPETTATYTPLPDASTTLKLGANWYGRIEIPFTVTGCTFAQVEDSEGMLTFPSIPGFAHDFL